MADGARMPAYADLLRRALSMGLQELDSAVVRLPGDASYNHAVVLATARMRGGVLLRAVGEASAAGGADDGAASLVTRAETHAKTRVLCEVMCLVEDAAPAERPRAGDDSAAAAPSEARPDDGYEPKPAETRGAVARLPSLEDTERGACAPVLSLVSTWPADTPVPFGGEQASAVPRHRDCESPGDRDARAKYVAPAARQGGLPRQAPTNIAAAIGPDVLARLLQLTRRKADAEGAPISEEVAMERLNSYFLRAFGHLVAGATQIEGQRVVQRLISESGRAPGSRPRS